MAKAIATTARRDLRRSIKCLAVVSGFLRIRLLGLLLAWFQEFVEGAIQFFADRFAGALLKELAGEAGDGAVVHLWFGERAVHRDLNRLALQAVEQRFFGDPGVLDRDLDGERNGFVEADRALRADDDIADLEFH